MHGPTRRLHRTRSVPAARKSRWLSGKFPLLNSECVVQLVQLGHDEEVTEHVIQQLRSETDPLLQAVLIQFLGLQVDNAAALDALSQAVPGLLADPHRLGPPHRRQAAR